MNDRIEKTNKYFRERLKTFTKDEIIEGLISSGNFINIDRIVNRCVMQRSLNNIQRREEQERKKEKAFTQAVEEYYALVEELNRVGIKNFSLKKVERLGKLKDIMEKNS